MKFLRDKVDLLKPHFSEGGKLSFLHSTFDAIETFLFVPNHTTKGGAHIKDGIDLKRTMFFVVIALIPALLFGMWNLGYQFHRATGAEATLLENFWHGLLQTLPLIIVSYGVGLAIEMAFAQFKGHPVNEGFLVSGLLIPMVMPVDVPLWMVGVATAFAVVIGKEVFGGTGMNLLNPALTARMFLYIGYTPEMSGEKCWVPLGDQAAVEGYSGATTLGNIASASADGSGWSDSLFSWGTGAMDSIYGTIPGSVAETSVIAILIGAVFLIATGIGSWRIMLSTILGGLAMGAILNLVGGNAWYDMPAWYHLIIGGFMFGAIFMATDPVSAAQTTRGKWIYGFFIGVITVLIRVYNPGYPEGIMMAILLMNVFAPLIDYYVVQSNIKMRLKRVKA